MFEEMLFLLMWQSGRLRIVVVGASDQCGRGLATELGSMLTSVWVWDENTI
jgi:5,10-methylene-tetrahydrofolate dehydrogenase/methenyl tetrahydrofolate cyclohydrolase